MGVNSSGDTAVGEGLHGATQEKKTRADQLVGTEGTDIAQQGNHSGGPGNTGKYVSRIQNTIANAQQEIINMTRDQGREP